MKKKKKESSEHLDSWIKKLKIKTSKQVKVPKKLIDQVIGQDDAVEVIKKAAEQRRHVMLIGDPGTGKSMLARAMAELLPPQELEDVIAYPNDEEPNNPKIRVVPAGKGEDIVKTQKAEAMFKKDQKSRMKFFFIFIIAIITIIAFYFVGELFILLIGLIAVAFVWFAMRGGLIPKNESDNIPKLLINNKNQKQAPFEDATGSHAGALLGDVKHDPFQSGGLETPAHERVEVGSIHKANKGVLFTDEINLLRIESQQSLLTAMQEKEFSITGQSERSSGAMVKSEPVPCNFTLVAAGNLDSIYGTEDKDGIRHGGMHPALRSRIRGYGYEVYVNTTMNDTHRNRMKMVRFIAQEVSKDEKIPHFDRMAIKEIIHEAQRRSGQRGKLSLRFRELGGLIRAAGDIAIENKAKMVNKKFVMQARKIARSLEQQVADRYIEKKKEYDDFIVTGIAVGVVNGMGVMGGDTSMGEYSGIILPINAEVTPAQSKDGGNIIATGKLGDMAKESVLNVSALIKKYTGQDISNYDVHIQFVGSREGTEGDSASISVATAVISALENIAVKQDVAMTGSLSIRGTVLPIGAVTAKIEAAAKVGIRTVLIPKANMKDVLIDDEFKKDLTVIPVTTLNDVLNHALVGSPNKTNFLDRLKEFIPTEGTPISTYNVPSY
jgi:Lon-like ATP-dependent protease